MSKTTGQRRVLRLKPFPDTQERDPTTTTLCLNVEVPACGTSTAAIHVPRGTARPLFLSPDPRTPNGTLASWECGLVTVTEWTVGATERVDPNLPKPLWCYAQLPFLFEIQEEGQMCVTLENASAQPFRCVIELKISKYHAEEWASLRRRLWNQPFYVNQPYSMGRMVARARRYLARHERRGRRGARAIRQSTALRFLLGFAVSIVR